MSTSTYRPARVMEKACRLILAATGEEYGDGYTVTNVIAGYAEPGYSSDPEAVVVLGDWNPRPVPGEDRWKSAHKDVTLPVRLAAALERVGASIEWHDEWTQCGECYRAVRTSADSYHWKPSYVFLEDAGPTCADCLVGYGEDALTDYLNDATKCITWTEPSHVESLGFVKWAPGNEQTYESGWHPGQNDDPAAILADIQREEPGADVVFFLDESSQFYIRFSAYIRDAVTDTDTAPTDWRLTLS